MAVWFPCGSGVINLRQNLSLSFITSEVEVPQIQRRRLDIAELLLTTDVKTSFAIEYGNSTKDYLLIKHFVIPVTALLHN